MANSRQIRLEDESCGCTRHKARDWLLTNIDQETTTLSNSGLILGLRSANERLCYFSQWETVLLCNDVSHWLVASLESALKFLPKHLPLPRASPMVNLWLSNFSPSAMLNRACLIAVSRFVSRCWIGPGCTVETGRTFLTGGAGTFIRVYSLAVTAWWRHQMEIFSALLPFCVGNSPVTGEFPSQKPVTRSYDIFFDLRLNQQLSKQWRHLLLTKRNQIIKLFGSPQIIISDTNVSYLF